ncbi:GDP-mannose transporter into the lumen of the Golgi [Borealophlyctis nickersoniae]|nr:GDP-mannose transporter into the lumen of the Golgi [Borealophlyctis nickersoniae]
MSQVTGPAAAIGAYCMSSILMTVTNKLVLSAFDFKMNFLLLAIQDLVCVLLLEGFVKLNMAQHRPFKVSDAKRWLSVACALVAMIYTGSKAVQYLSIPLFTVFKNLTIILIAYAERTFFGGSPVTRLMFLSFALMVFSSLIAGWADIAAGKGLNKDAKQVPWVVSYGWMVANCLTTSGFALLMKGKIKEVGFKDFDTVFYNNAISVPILLVFSFMFEQQEGHRVYTQYFGPVDPTQAAERSTQFWGLVAGILVSGVSSFAISYSTAWCVRVTSSTTYSMVGSLNKLPIAVAGMIFFSDPVTFGGVAGVFIAFFAGIVYNHAKNMQNLPPPSNPPLPLYKMKDEARDSLIDKAEKI